MNTYNETNAIQTLKELSGDSSSKNILFGDGFYQKKFNDKVFIFLTPEANFNSDSWSEILKQKLPLVVSGTAPRSMRAAFCLCQAKSVFFKDLDTSQTESMHFMFAHAKTKFIDLPNLDMSHVKDLSGMFYNCNTGDIDLSEKDLHCAEYMNDMFRGCRADNISIKNANACNLEGVSLLFYNCSANTITLENMFMGDRVGCAVSMFSGCEANIINLHGLHLAGMKDLDCIFAHCRAAIIDLSDAYFGKADGSLMFYFCESGRIDASGCQMALTKMKFQGAHIGTLITSGAVRNDLNENDSFKYTCNAKKQPETQDIDQNSIVYEHLFSKNHGYSCRPLSLKYSLIEQLCLFERHGDFIVYSGGADEDIRKAKDLLLFEAKRMYGPALEKQVATAQAKLDRFNEKLNKLLSTSVERNVESLDTEEREY